MTNTLPVSTTLHAAVGAANHEAMQLEPTDVETAVARLEPAIDRFTDWISGGRATRKGNEAREEAKKSRGWFDNLIGPSAEQQRREDEAAAEAARKSYGRVSGIIQTAAKAALPSALTAHQKHRQAGFLSDLVYLATESLGPTPVSVMAYVNSHTIRPFGLAASIADRGRAPKNAREFRDPGTMTPEFKLYAGRVAVVARAKALAMRSDGVAFEDLFGMALDHELREILKTAPGMTRTEMRQMESDWYAGYEDDAADAAAVGLIASTSVWTVCGTLGLDPAIRDAVVARVRDYDDPDRGRRDRVLETSRRSAATVGRAMQTAGYAGIAGPHSVLLSSVGTVVLDAFDGTDVDSDAVKAVLAEQSR